MAHWATPAIKTKQPAGLCSRQVVVMLADLYRLADTLLVLARAAINADLVARINEQGNANRCAGINRSGLE